MANPYKTHSSENVRLACVSGNLLKQPDPAGSSKEISILATEHLETF
jgi:hypothetical protein